MFYSPRSVYGGRGPPAPPIARPPVFGGESASSADSTLAREVSARCTGSTHAAHYPGTALMPYELGIAGGGSAGEHAREKRELEVGEEADNGPWAHLSAKESTVLSGATSIF